MTAQTTATCPALTEWRRGWTLPVAATLGTTTGSTANRTMPWRPLAVGVLMLQATISASFYQKAA